MTGSLYKLTFPNGKVYIGISTNVARRWNWHASCASRGAGWAVHRAIAKFGWESVRKEVLVVGLWDDIKAAERALIATLRCTPPNGYNLTLGGDGTVGRVVSASERKAISARMRGNAHTKGRVYSEEERAAFRGWHHTDASRAAIGAGNKGKVVSPEARARMSAAAGNRAWSEESRAKLSRALRGNQNKKGKPVSKEQAHQHKEFFVRVRRFISETGYAGDARHVTKAMIEDHDRARGALSWKFVDAAQKGN